MVEGIGSKTWSVPGPYMVAQVDWMIMDRRSTAVAAAVCTQLYACTAAGTAVRRGVRLTSCVCTCYVYTRIVLEVHSGTTLVLEYP